MGSLASQAVAVGLGVQNKVSLKDAFSSGAMSGFGAVAGYGIGEIAQASNLSPAIKTVLTGSEWYQVAAQAAISSTVSNGLGSLAGVTSFRWNKVAVAGISLGA